LVPTFRVDPVEDQIGDLKIVLVLHDHVAVAVNAELGRVQHFGVALGSVHACDEVLAIFESA